MRMCGSERPRTRRGAPDLVEKSDAPRWLLSASREARRIAGKSAAPADASAFRGR